MLVLHLHQHQSSRNLHLQYLAKNQSTQRCQPLITPGSHHPPVLESLMVLNESGTVHASSRIRPLLLNTLPTSCSRKRPIPAEICPDDGKRTQRHKQNKSYLTYYWRIKLISTYDMQAYGPTPFSPRGFPRFLSIRGARGFHTFDLPLLTNLSKP
jgi:hypothetical protein